MSISRKLLQTTQNNQCPPCGWRGSGSLLPLADMVDVSAELQQLSKHISKMQSEYDALIASLSSPSFVEKAPEEVVRGVREKATETEERLKLNCLSFLESTVSV